MSAEEGSARWWRLVAAAVVAVVTLTACGSTAQPDRSGDARADARMAEDGLVPADSATSDDLGGTEGVFPSEPLPAIERNGGAAPGAGGISEGAGSTATAPAAGSASGPATGQGFTEDEIYIGYGTANNASEVFKTFGIAVTLGDQEAQARAIADDLNTRGGIAGRKVVVVTYDFGASSIYDPQAAAQAACTHWTEDRPVFAVVNVFALAAGDETFNACLAKRGTVHSAMSPQLRPAAVYDRYVPSLYAPANVSMERFVPRWLQRLDATGYFEGWDTTMGRPGPAPVKVGILANRAVYGERFLQVTQVVLARHGREVAATYEYSGEVSTISSEMNSAVLRFRSEGVTHVITPQGMEPFAQAAESQSYRPRYALSSFHNPTFAQTIAPRGQLSGALGVGWAPTLDVDTAQDPGDVSEAQTRCRRVMEEAGEDTSARQAFLLMVLACDGFNFVANAVAAGGLSPVAVGRGAVTMAPMPPASTFAIQFGPNRFDGAAAVRDTRFDDGCGCFVYLNNALHDM